MHLPLIEWVYGKSGEGDSARGQFGCRGASDAFVKRGSSYESLFTYGSNLPIFAKYLLWISSADRATRPLVKMSKLTYFAGKPGFNLTYKTQFPGHHRSRKDQRSKINYWRGRFDSEFAETKAKIPALRPGREEITSNFSDNFYFHYLLVETGSCGSWDRRSSRSIL